MYVLTLEVADRVNELCAIEELTAEEGAELKRCAQHLNLYLTHPSFDKEGKDLNPILAPLTLARRKY